MTQAVILAAGRSTRNGGSFKPRVQIGNKATWRWQQPNLPEQVTIIGPSTRQCPTSGPMPDADFYMFDGYGGPVNALAAVLPHLGWDGPLVVCYADTIFFGDLPDGDWCGLSAAAGGRTWDFYADGQYRREEVDRGDWVNVCIGLYQFTDMGDLAIACEQALLEEREVETHMWRVANKLGLLPEPFEWFDVGDPAAIERATQQLKVRGMVDG